MATSVGDKYTMWGICTLYIYGINMDWILDIGGLVDWWILEITIEVNEEEVKSILAWNPVNHIYYHLHEFIDSIVHDLEE